MQLSAKCFFLVRWNSRYLITVFRSGFSETEVYDVLVKSKDVGFLQLPVVNVHLCIFCMITSQM